ncbi:Mth938-like domain-containing protein [Methylophilaceae bacterium]|jgi:uncharacterized protein|nr:Mth938-like domain-containing protein [Methylophilaceae bacterium]
MKFHEINSDTHNIIDAYDHNSIRIKKNTYQKGVIIFPEKIISRSAMASYEDLKFDNLKEVFDYSPELILIGSNIKNKIIDKNAQILFIEKKIAYENMNFDAACRTFNILLSEQRKVVLILM